MLFSKLHKKCLGVEYSIPHILKSFVYLNDADGQPMPRMHQDIEWEKVKKIIAQEVKKITF